MKLNGAKFKIDKNRFLAGLLLALLMAGMPLYAVAQTPDTANTEEEATEEEKPVLSENSRVSVFYEVITRQAYINTFEDKLLPKNFTNTHDLEITLVENEELYKENLILAAMSYFKGLSHDDARQLYYNLTRAPFRKGNSERNLMSAFINDQESYDRGRPYKKNPLFIALYNLGQNGKISENSAKGYILAVRYMTSDYVPEESITVAFNTQALHKAMIEKIMPIVGIEEPQEPEPEEEHLSQNQSPLQSRK
ncbi:MAG: hypothetical protein R3D88_07580 [Alphaproteobacteria bacterium]|nr:hypothetical protein [Alphaproteobacteria bacterium]